MFAIIEESGRQVRVSEGETLDIDFQAGAEEGQEIIFDRVLLANAGGTSAIGTPVIDAASVTAKVIDPLKKGPKLEVQKIRRRKNSRRHTGHRQKYTTVEITSIQVPGLEVAEGQPESAPVAADG